jgi:hypothetical protein
MSLRTWGLAGVVVVHAVAAAPAWASEPAPSAERAAGQVVATQPSDAGETDFLTSPRPRPSERAPDAVQSDQCRWLGTRIISLLSRDDAMTAKHFDPFYDRFGCPEDHLSEAFGCVVGGGGPGQDEELASRVERCWTDPVEGGLPTGILGDDEVPEDDQEKSADKGT